MTSRSSSSSIVTTTCVGGVEEAQPAHPGAVAAGLRVDVGDRPVVDRRAPTTEEGRGATVRVALVRPAPDPVDGDDPGRQLEAHADAGDVVQLRRDGHLVGDEVTVDRRRQGDSLMGVGQIERRPARRMPGAEHLVVDRGAPQRQPRRQLPPRPRRACAPPSGPARPATAPHRRRARRGAPPASPPGPAGTPERRRRSTPPARATAVRACRGSTYEPSTPTDHSTSATSARSVKSCLLVMRTTPPPSDSKPTGWSTTAASSSDGCGVRSAATRPLRQNGPSFGSSPKSPP